MDRRREREGREDGIPVAGRKGDVDNKRWTAGSCEKINPVQASSVLLLPWSGLACAAAGRGELGVLENLKVGPDTSRLAASNSPHTGPCSSHPARLPVSLDLSFSCSSL